MSWTLTSSDGSTRSPTCLCSSLASLTRGLPTPCGPKRCVLCGLCLECRRWRLLRVPGECVSVGCAVVSTPASLVPPQKLYQRFRHRRMKCGEDDDGYAVKMKLKYFLRYMDVQTDDSPLYVFDSSFDDDDKVRVPTVWRAHFHLSFPLPPAHLPPHPPRLLTTPLNISKTADGGHSVRVHCPEVLPGRLVPAGGRERPAAVPMVPHRSRSVRHRAAHRPAGHQRVEHTAEWWHASQDSCGGTVVAVLPQDYFTNLLPRIKQSPLVHDVIEFVQEPGETVFVPGGWWHAVLNIENAIAITQNFASRVNFPRVGSGCGRVIVHRIFYPRPPPPPLSTYGSF